MFNSIISQLLVWSLQIKNQTQKYGNTETLVGGLFEQIIALIKSIADYISNIIFGFIRQPGVDTYNDTSDGKTSLLNSYPTPEKGWTVLVRNDETNEGQATLYQWNGTAWINLDTVVYLDDIALNGGTDNNLKQVEDIATFVNQNYDNRLRTLTGTVHSSILTSTGNVGTLPDTMEYRHYGVISDIASTGTYTFAELGSVFVASNFLGYNYGPNGYLSQGNTIRFKIRYRGNIPNVMLVLAVGSSFPSIELTVSEEWTTIVADKTLNVSSPSIIGIALQIRKLLQTTGATTGQYLDIAYIEFCNLSKPYSIVNGLTTVSGMQIDTKTQSAGNVNYQQPKTDIVLCEIYGQSLSTGQQTAPPISTTNYKGNLMIGDKEWYNLGSNPVNALNLLTAVPLSGTQAEAEALPPTDQLNCETPNIGFVNHVKSMLDKHLIGLADRKMLAVSAGVGGQSIELLSRNCPNNGGIRYTKLVESMTKARDLSTAAGKTISMSSLIWMQGENNYIAAAGQGWTSSLPATNDKIQYKTYLDQLITDIGNSAKVVFSQEYSPIVLTYQPAPSYMRSFDMPIGMALLETAQTDKRIVLASPTYCVTDRGGHLCPNGSRWMGERLAKVYYKTVIKGEKWLPLCPHKITRYRNTILIDFHVPEPPLRFDTLTVRNVANYGFVVKDNGVNMTISGVSIQSHTQVLITLTAIPSGDVEIGYASYNTSYGNLCDSDSYMSFETYKELPTQLKPTFEPKDSLGNVIYGKPYPLHNFCVQFYYKMLVEESVKLIF